MIDRFLLRTVNSIGFAVLNNDVPAYFADVNFLVKFIWNVQIFSFSAFSGCRIRRHSFDSGKRHHHECHAQRQQNCQNSLSPLHFVPSFFSFAIRPFRSWSRTQSNVKTTAAKNETTATKT